MAKTDELSMASEITAYVQWGSANHMYADLAVESGHWNEGLEAPSFFATGSLEYIEGEWVNSAVPTICAENGTGCDIKQLTSVVINDE